jgi:hypothetical protein
VAIENKNLMRKMFHVCFLSTGFVVGVVKPVDSLLFVVG